MENMKETELENLENVAGGTPRAFPEENAADARILKMRWKS